MRRACTVLLLASFVACTDQPTAPVGSTGPGIDAPALAVVPAGAATYEVTVTNETGGQPFTPPLAVTHKKSLKVFEVGEAASHGVQEIAENGNLAPLSAALDGDKSVSDVVIALGSPPPILPGTSRSFTITADKGAKYLSFVSMLICTNDGFTGLSSADLPKHAGETSVHTLMAYDAGTEINTEDFADMVPPCPALTGVPSSVPGTGMSNPALAEHGVITMHPGIQGIADADPAIHGWSGPVATVTITRIDKSEKSKKSDKAKSKKKGGST